MLLATTIVAYKPTIEALMLLANASAAYQASWIQLTKHHNSAYKAHFLAYEAHSLLTQH